MSFQAMAWAVEQELPMREKMVLLMLANYASNERGDCHPSVALLAKDCGTSKDSVLRAIKALEDAGLLAVNRRMKDGVNLPNTYTLNLRGVVAECDHGSSTQRGGVVADCDSNLSVEPINPSSLRSEGKREPTQFDELAKVLDTDHVNAVIAHRKNFKSKFSPYAARLLAKEFAKCADPNLAAETMIRNGWQGFEAEWMQRQQSRGSPPRTSTSALADSAARLAQTMRTADEIRSGSSGSGVRAAIPHLPVR